MPIPNHPRVKISVVAGPDTGLNLMFLNYPFVIGRSQDCDVVLANDPKCSRAHVRIERRKNSIWAVKVTEKALMVVDGLPLEQKEIKGSSILILGDTHVRIIIETPGEEDLSPQLNSPHAIAIQQQSAPIQAFPNESRHLGSPRRYDPENEDVPDDRTSIVKRRRPQKSKSTFYIVVAIIILALFYLLSSPTKKKKDSGIKTSQEILKELEKSKASLEQIQEQQKTKGTQFEQAQSHFVKGFRDYRQGQFSRAIVSFKAALVFYPEHMMAAKYMKLAEKRIDELVTFNLQQGRRYLDKQNYRLCEASFNNVLILLGDKDNPRFTEAQQLRDECAAQKAGRY